MPDSACFQCDQIQTPGRQRRQDKQRCGVTAIGQENIGERIKEGYSPDPQFLMTGCFNVVIPTVWKSGGNGEFFQMRRRSRIQSQ